MKENSIEEDIKNIEEIIELSKEEIATENENITAILDITDLISLEHILSDYKRILKENETYKKQYFCLIDKIENKIDKFDYKFEKAKRKNYQERADYYWDLIINFKKLLEEEQ